MPLSSLGADDADGGGGVSDGALAAAVYALLSEACDLWANLPSAVELFAPVATLLAAAPADELPPALAPAHAACVAQIDETVAAAARARVPLRLGRKAPVALKQYNPVFDEEFDPNRSSDPDRRRAELQKLKRKTKAEHKGAMRELRKDNAFLAAATAADTAKRDEYLEGRGKRALQIMEEQEASWKSMKREKKGGGKPRALV